MAVSSVNITIQKGTNFSETFILFNDDGRLLDLSDFTENGVLNVIAKLKKYPSSPTSYSFAYSVLLNLSEIEIRMTPEVTATLPTGRCYYDIILSQPNAGDAQLVVQGQALVEETTLA